MVDGPQAAAQIADLLAETNPGLGDLIANLLTTSEVTLTRGADLDELLSALPAAVSVGSTAVTSKGATFGLALTFFDPLPCTAGYGGTAFLNGLDTSPDAPLNTGAYCAKPASSGVDVRGSAHAPAAAAYRPPRSREWPSFSVWRREAAAAAYDDGIPAGCHPASGGADD